MICKQMQKKRRSLESYSTFVIWLCLEWLIDSGPSDKAVCDFSKWHTFFFHQEKYAQYFYIQPRNKAGNITGTLLLSSLTT